MVSRKRVNRTKFKHIRTERRTQLAKRRKAKFSSASFNSFPRELPGRRVSAIQGVPISTSVARLAGNEEHLTVGPWPRTKAERERAAKKYNLIPEDYEPHDEGEALGDYPKLKEIGAFNRDPYDDYDDQYDMRFYGEVFHKDADLYYWERVDPWADHKMRFPHWVQFSSFIGLAVFFPILKYFFDKYRIQINQPWKMRNRHPPDTKYYHFPSSSVEAH